MDARLSRPAQQHWSLKKERGRTNQLPTRQGHVPSSYELLEDRWAMGLLVERIRRVEHDALRSCLERLFETREWQADKVNADWNAPATTHLSRTSLRLRSSRTG